MPTAEIIVGNVQSDGHRTAGVTTTVSQSKSRMVKRKAAPVKTGKES